MKNIHKQGFTLIELLVVVLIIGILAGIALPQYTKAVTKSRFAEALINLKSIAQAHKICFLEKGDSCSFDELSIDLGETTNQTSVAMMSQFVRKTKYFEYASVANDASNNPIWALVYYPKENISICYLQNDEIVINQSADCTSGTASFDYAKLLNLRDVGNNGCMPC